MSADPYRWCEKRELANDYTMNVRYAIVGASGQAIAYANTKIAARMIARLLNDRAERLSHSSRNGV